MPYQFHSDSKQLSSDQEKYLLSPKDINTITILPELVEAGIDSFKIEGRMKRPEYAAAVSSMYRKYVDLFFKLGKEKYSQHMKSNDFEKDMIQLQDVYNRGGFSEGYGKTYNSKKMMSLYRPNHSGVAVGVVSEINKSQVSIELKEQVNAQDILEIRHREEEGYEFTVKDPHNAGQVLRTNVGRRREVVGQEKSHGSRTQKFADPIVCVGDQVYRTKNNRLLEQLQEDYMNKDQRLGIKGILTARCGEELKLTLTVGECSVTAYQGVVQEAMKQPMTKEKLSAPIEKTGDTLYFFEELTVESEDNIFVPVAWLNELRRDAIDKLTVAAAMQYRRDRETNRKSSQKQEKDGVVGSNTKVSEEMSQINDTKASVSSSNQEMPSKTGISISVQTMEQFGIALQYPEVTAIYADYDTLARNEFIKMANLTKEAGKSFYLSLPHICRLIEYERLKKDLLEIIEVEAICGFIVKNFEEIALLQSLGINREHQKKLILNYNMYIYNQEAKSFWKEQGISRFTAPVELNYQELKTLGITDCDMIVYGYQMLMVSAQCLFESTEGCRNCKAGNSNQASDSHTGYLTDRLGKKFFVQTNCNGCYNIIYNGQPLSLLKQETEIQSLYPQNIRLDFSKESAEEMKQVVILFIERYRYGKKNSLELSDYTTGHFKRGVE
jgi:putative protease